MHSSPIDLLANAPKSRMAAPTESEPDGRFSELLRGPSEAESKQPDTTPAPKSKQAAPAEGPSQTEAGTEAPVDVEHHMAVEPAAETATPESPATDKISIAPLVVVPEAITWAQPQGGAVVGGVPVGAPELPSGPPLAQLPKPADPTVTPVTTPTDANRDGTPIPTGSANGVPPAPQGQIPANPAIPVEGSGLPNPTEPGNPSAFTAAPAKASPVAATQPVVATAAPVAAAGKTIPGGDTPGETARTSAAAEGEAATPNTILPDRQTSTPTPERLATSHAPTSITIEPAARKDTLDPPATPDSKVGPDLNRAATTIPAPKPSTPPAATLLATDKPAAAAAAAIPSTVTETADAAPPASQTDPAAAAANFGPIGRMTATAASSTNFAHTPTTAQPAAEQVVLQVQRAVRDGVDRLTMQLKPASLGRVDIQMEVGFDGRLQAVISAERPETLHLLQRDARALTQALNDAGLQTDSGSLSFNLRGQSGDHGGGNGHEPSDATAAARSNAADDPSAAATEITLTLGDGRVDIRV